MIFFSQSFKYYNPIIHITSIPILTIDNFLTMQMYLDNINKLIKEQKNEK